MVRAGSWAGGACDWLGTAGRGRRRASGGAGEQPCGPLAHWPSAVFAPSPARLSWHRRVVATKARWLVVWLYASEPAVRYDGSQQGTGDWAAAKDGLRARKKNGRKDVPKLGMAKLGAGAEAWDRVQVEWSDLDRCDCRSLLRLCSIYYTIHIALLLLLSPLSHSPSPLRSSFARPPRRRQTLSPPRPPCCQQDPCSRCPSPSRHPPPHTFPPLPSPLLQRARPQVTLYHPQYPSSPRRQCRPLCRPQLHNAIRNRRACLVVYRSSRSRSVASPIICPMRHFSCSNPFPNYNLIISKPRLAPHCSNEHPHRLLNPQDALRRASSQRSPGDVLRHPFATLHPPPPN